MTSLSLVDGELADPGVVFNDQDRKAPAMFHAVKEFEYFHVAEDIL